MAAPSVPAAPVATFLVERYWPGVTLEAFSEAQRRLSDEVEAMRRDGIAIQTIAATLVPGDEAAYWVVDAPSADVIAVACRRAGVTPERIVGALELRREREAADPAPQPV